MSKRVLLWMMMGAGLTASQAQANVYVNEGDKLWLLQANSASLAGTFHATGVSPVYAFDTFCAEADQGLLQGIVYEISSIGTSSDGGNATMTGYTAWLYTNYLSGDLAALGYDESDAADQDALQLAIWTSLGYSQTELQAIYSTAPDSTLLANAYSATLLGDLLTAYLGSGWGSSLGNVRIASLTVNDSYYPSLNGQKGQDVLVMVPAPGAAALAIFGLGLIGRLRRRLS